MSARTYTQQSNREGPRNTGEKKVVFKPVLDNPFRVRWPSVPINLQNAVLAYILTLLEGAGAYHKERCRVNRKRQRQEKVLEASKRRKPDDAKAISDSNSATTQHTAKDTDDAEGTISSPKPLILSHTILGLNAVTKRLEQQASEVRRTIVLPTGDTPSQHSPPIAYVFACRAEINPTMLIEHLPPLVAACNSVAGKQFVKLVPLPQGAEHKLASAFGIRSAGIFAVDAQFSGLPELSARLESIPTLTASWCTPSATPVQLVPTHIKHLCTSAPKDMKSTKEKRMQGKLAAKLKRKGAKSK